MVPMRMKEIKQMCYVGHHRNKRVFSHNEKLFKCKIRSKNPIYIYGLITRCRPNSKPECAEKNLYADFFGENSFVIDGVIYTVSKYGGSALTLSLIHI